MKVTGRKRGRGAGAWSGAASNSEMCGLLEGDASRLGRTNPEPPTGLGTNCKGIKPAEKDCIVGTEGRKEISACDS